MKRFPWDILLALLAGIGLGLVYSWLVSPVQVINSEPVALRADFKDSYRAAIAAAYASNGDLVRARARLSLLGDADPIPVLVTQSERMLVSGESFATVQQVVDLASALQQVNPVAGSTSSTPVPTRVANTLNTATVTLPPPPPDFPSAGQTATVEVTEVPTVLDTPTPRPTRTPVPTVGAPFAFTAQDIVCDPNLPEGLLQVVVLNSSRRPVPGAEIIITWSGGEEHFFTGLKPELGNGYADFIMTPETIYSVQLSLGSESASELTAPSCQTSSGETFTGGIKLTFQQP